MDDKVFIFLRLRVGETTLARSKIRELAGLGTLLADFLRKTSQEGVELPEGVDPRQGEVPVLDYVDANTNKNLISFRVDPIERMQVIEGCIPPPYQARMLDPETVSFSLRRFTDRAATNLPPERREELSEKLARAQIDLLERIRKTMDEEGNFRVQVPWNSQS